MNIGKLSAGDLEEIVLQRLPALSENITCGPATGLDCAAVRCPAGQVILSTDPITGAGVDIGRLAIHISCNDVAAFGVRPVALMLVILAPPSTTRDMLEQLVDQVAEAAKELDVSIVGGHTEISDAVNRFVLTTTALGFAEGQAMIHAGGAQAEDTLIMTKTAALEGTAILAADHGHELAGVLTEAERGEAAALIRAVSVVPEGLIGARCQVHAMHDATEGGILGAAWEMAAAAGLGLTVQIDLIPLHPLTERITAHFGLDPLRLISSGSLLLATNQPEHVLQALRQAGIQATSIGRFQAVPDFFIYHGNHEEILLPPGPDELYKIV